MKVTIIVDPLDHKLCGTAYSQTYYEMFRSFVELLDDDVKIVTKSCSIKDLNDPDVVIFWDLHSSCHSVSIEGIKEHHSFKIEMFNDPHQEEFKGKYKDGQEVHKLGSYQRIVRAINRGVKAIWCPYRDGFNRFLGRHVVSVDMELWWFPVSPSLGRFPNRSTKLIDRKHEILGNGAVHAGVMNCYDFRRWAFARLNVRYVNHAIIDESTPSGASFGNFLSEYVAALALCDWYPVPKYFEIPAAGCIPIVQWLPELEELGFRDGENCVVVNKGNFDEKTSVILESLKSGQVEELQRIADNSRELIESKYTAACFASWFLDKIEGTIK